MSWIDISVSPGSSGQGLGSNLLSGFIQSLGNALNNAHYGGISGFPRQLSNENEQIVGYYDDPNGYYAVIRKFLSQKNYYSNERLKNAFERLINHQNRINQLTQEITDKENAINSLNNEIHHINQEIDKLNQAISNINQEIDKLNQAISNINQEIANLNNEINALKNAIKQEQEKLNALELQSEAKKQIMESLKKLEKLKEELKRLKKKSKWKKQFTFLTDNNPDKESKQQRALQASQEHTAFFNFFLTDPYAILPKGFIYEYHNPGKETYNALNAPNNMDGINNQFKVNALNQVLDNSYQKFLPGNDSYNALGSIEQVKALKFYDLVLNYHPESENTQSALFFKQISQYAKGLRLKILTAKTSKKNLKRIEELEKTIKQEQERLNDKDLNALTQDLQKEQENALKLKESIKAKQNYTETLKNAINQKEHAKNPIIEQQRQNQQNAKREKEQERQNQQNAKREKEQQRQNQQNAKREKEQERQNLNNEINAIGNERLTIKELGIKDNFLGIQPYSNPTGRTYARAVFSDKNKSIKEYYEVETKMKNILGFYRIGESDERILQRFLQLSPAVQNELALLLLK
ncbi:UV radiation resistance protein [Helicobacter pylori]|uniref:UV radiation resistance protein n=1 Tax=Helicobacter pylori TaxID=210 RepID=A0ABD7CBM6_HELPX|nr:UV radiation resistance protein [Helicobacter pylori]QQW98975.1 UV radiation resistance protein [Helicobacter pylori]